MRRTWFSMDSWWWMVGKRSSNTVNWARRTFQLFEGIGVCRHFVRETPYGKIICQVLLGLGLSSWNLPKMFRSILKAIILLYVDLILCLFWIILDHDPFISIYVVSTFVLNMDILKPLGKLLKLHRFFPRNTGRVARSESFASRRRYQRVPWHTAGWLGAKWWFSSLVRWGIYEISSDNTS